jgi:uncharacterized protein (TIGR03435 family)
MSGGPGTPDPTRATFTRLPLHDLLGWAYGLNSDQISGPPWLTTELYNIVAKIPEGATREDFNVMLRNLLTDRFHLSVHFGKKDVPAYEMTVAKGRLHIKESDLSAPDPALGPDGRPASVPLTFKDGFPVLVPGNTPASWKGNVSGRILITARQQSMASIARTLQYAMGSSCRVVDKTGLTGVYDYHLQYRPDGDPGPATQGLPAEADFLDSIGEPAPTSSRPFGSNSDLC